MTHPTGWPTAQSISNIPEVRKAIDEFADCAAEDNELAMVSAILNSVHAGETEWTDPVSLGSVNRDYDQGFADGVSESKRLNGSRISSPASVRAAALEEERKAFEASYIKRGGMRLEDYDLDYRQDTNTYADDIEQAAWEGWQDRALSAAPAGGLGEVSANENIGRAARKIVASLADSPVSALSNLVQAIQDADAISAAQGEGK